MGKVSHRSPLVSPRRRLLKASSGVGVKKNRGSAKVCLPTPPPPIQSLVDEDSGFGGDQSLDSESSLLSAPGSSNSGLASLTSILPSLAMVPQTGVDSQVNLAGSRLPVDVSGDEAQELPGSIGFKNSRQVPPLISFRDVSLLSSLHSLRSSTTTTTTSTPGSTPMVRVEGTPQPCGRSKKILRQSAVTHASSPLNAQLSSQSSDGSVELMLVSQPEEQHRARYQTEGSRGAVKDREGKGHPTVKLVGYTKPTIVQVFVGDDCVRTSPHMFYQVCRVSGKNSTACKERRIDGTAVIEASLDPDSDMIMSCDCVGILKERNVDVEHRFKAVVSRGRKKSTKCCLVFRTFITLPNGVQETLQVVSRPIACTQPPGVPEISRKSLSSCSASGGEEIFIFGKNFSKDTVVIFQETSAKAQPVWEQTVIPEKETLQPIHLIVTVPKYYDEMITEEVTVQMVVSSGSKVSEPHNFTYMPKVSKKELQGHHEIPEEKFLPKGVSLGALQLNRHYAETRTLPAVMQEVSASVKNSNSHLKMTSGVRRTAPHVQGCGVQRRAARSRVQHGAPHIQGCTHPGPVTKSVVSSMRVPRIVQNSIPNRKVAGRTNRTSAQISKTPLVVNKTVVSTAGVNTIQTVASVSSANVNMAEIKKDMDEEGKFQEQEKEEHAKGTVSLGSLVELLNVVQSLPSGSIEELVRSMKENITTPVSAKMQITQDTSNITQEHRINNTSLQNLLQGKVQKCSAQASLLVPQDVTNKIMPTVTTNMGLWPLTLFPSISTAQSMAGGPRVARVAPIAPTTVVSSPGLTRTVRVCVAEAPNISLEPPKKKQRDHLTPMEYELVERNQLVSVERNQLVSVERNQLVNVERNQLVSEPVVNGAMSAPIVSQTPEIPYNNTRQPTTQEVINNQCDSQNNTTAVSTSSAQECTFIHSTSQGAAETPSVLSSAVGNTLNAPQQQPLYQNITQSLLQTIGQAPQQVSQPLNVNVTLNQAPEMNPPLSVSLGQSIQQVNQPMNVSLNHTSQEVSQSIAVTLNQNLQEERQPLNVSCLPSTPEVNQVVRQPEQQVISQHTNPQDMNVSPAVPTSASGPLFTQSTNMGTSQIVVAAHAVITSSSSSQATLAPHSVASSALTHSDPLLSQSVAPLQLDQSGAAPPPRNQPSEPRPRGEVLMTPSSNASQVSMQNEVTSAINLSETELLNYFDPNCFDNV